MCYNMLPKVHLNFAATTSTSTGGITTQAMSQVDMGQWISGLSGAAGNPG